MHGKGNQMKLLKEYDLLLQYTCPNNPDNKVVQEVVNRIITTVSSTTHLSSSIHVDCYVCGEKHTAVIKTER